MKIPDKNSDKLSKLSIRSKIVINESEKGDLEKEKVYMDMFNKFHVNPFVSELYEMVYKKNGRKRISKFITKSKHVLDSQTGELEDLIIGVKEYVDDRTFIKLYQENMRAVFGLSGGAVKLFMYAGSLLEKNSLTVDLYTDTICEVLKISPNTLYRLIKELISLNILARSTRIYRFFINPTYLFNGNAITVVKQYINVDALRIDRENALQDKLERERSFSGLIDKWARQIEDINRQQEQIEYETIGDKQPLDMDQEISSDTQQVVSSPWDDAIYTSDDTN